MYVINYAKLDTGVHDGQNHISEGMLSGIIGYTKQ